LAAAEGPAEAQAFAHCARVVKEGAKNFYYAFAILPRPKRDAMYALYAFCREADDAVDEGGSRDEKAAALATIRAGLDDCFAGKPAGPMFTALALVADRHRLAKQHLVDVVDGCAMDLDQARYETYADLELYLDRVASAVGRATMQIFGLDPAQHPAYARAGGQAVQLTNILRDIQEDHARGRIYIPQEDLRRFSVPESDLGAATPSPAFRELMKFEVERNRKLYREARETLSDRDRRRILPLHAIVRIYRRVLDAIERRGYDVLGERISVPGWRKALLGIGTWIRAKMRLPMGT
jgi:phytoene synthase